MKTVQVPRYEDVSPANQALFDNLKKGLGMVPNLYATLAYSEHALATYLALQNAPASLRGQAREVVNLAVSQVNGCAYCLAAHTVIGGLVGLKPEQILEVRRGGASWDARLDALVRLAHGVTRERGHVDPALVQAFFAAGWSAGHLVDAIVLIGDKTITNYLHASTQVPVDFPPAPPLH